MEKARRLSGYQTRTLSALALFQIVCLVDDCTSGDVCSTGTHGGAVTVREGLYKPNYLLSPLSQMHVPHCSLPSTRDWPPASCVLDKALSLSFVPGPQRDF